MKVLYEQEDHYFDLESTTQTRQGDDSEDESDSDYETELLSLSEQDNTESIDDVGCPSDEITSTNQVSCANKASHLSRQPSQVFQFQECKWEVECTSQVLKKLKHRKTPPYLIKAIFSTVFNDLACGRHWVQVNTNNKEHKLYQRKILLGKVTILWEKAILFTKVKPVQ